MYPTKPARFVLLALAFLVLAAAPVRAIDFGLIAGTQSNGTTSGLFYGLSSNTGMIVPLIKMEWEGYRYSELEGYTVTVAAKLKPQFGAFSPYAAVGVGVDFTAITFDFSQYSSFSFLAFGLHIYLAPMLSLRGDARFQYFSAVTRNRFSAGIFIHL
jgi:hypothetical protein